MLFEARGKVVSGGVDVALFSAIAEGEGAAQHGAELWRRLLRITHAVEELPVPTVFAAHGLTLTAAFELALACDLLLASERASFGLVERVVGLAPSMGGPQRLAERAGPAGRRNWCTPASGTRPARSSGGTWSTRCSPTRFRPGRAGLRPRPRGRPDAGPRGDHAAGDHCGPGRRRAADDITPALRARCSAPPTCARRSPAS